MADIVFQQDLPAWLATKSTTRKYTRECVTTAPGIGTETDTAFALARGVVPPPDRVFTFAADRLDTHRTWDL